MNDHLENLINGLSPRHHQPLRDQLKDIANMSHRDVLSLKSQLNTDLATAHAGETVAQIAPIVNVAIAERIMSLEGREVTTANMESTHDKTQFDKLVDAAAKEATSPGMAEAMAKAKQGIPTDAVANAKAAAYAKAAEAAKDEA